MSSDVSIAVSAAISSVLLIIGIISYFHTKRFLANAVETYGTVIDMVIKGNPQSGKVAYSPKIRFTDRAGKQVVFTEKWAMINPDCKTGDEVTVLFDPSNPLNAKRLGKKWRLFFGAWLMGGMGLLFLILLFLVVAVMLVSKKYLG